MPMEIEKLGLILKRIGNFSMDNFEGRLIFQKTVYLMQAFGIYLGYRFSWYLYGPYSPELASDGFRLAEIYGPLMPEGRFKDQGMEGIFKLFLEFLGDRRDDAEWLELLASVHFLRKLYPDVAKDEVISMVLKKQPYFDKRKCEEAWKHLEKYGLL